MSKYFKDRGKLADALNELMPFNLDEHYYVMTMLAEEWPQINDQTRLKTFPRRISQINYYRGSREITVPRAGTAYLWRLFGALFKRRDWYERGYKVRYVEWWDSAPVKVLRSTFGADPYALELIDDAALDYRRIRRSLFSAMVIFCAYTPCDDTLYLYWEVNDEPKLKRP